MLSVVHPFFLFFPSVFFLTNPSDLTPTFTAPVDKGPRAERARSSGDKTRSTPETRATCTLPGSRDRVGRSRDDVLRVRVYDGVRARTEEIRGIFDTAAAAMAVLKTTVLIGLTVYGVSVAFDKYVFAV